MNLLKFIFSFLIVMTIGCADVPASSVDPESGIGGRLEGGDAGSSATNRKVHTAVAGSYLGDSAVSNNNTELSRQVSNASAGDIQQGFSFAAQTAATAEARQKTIDNDPLIISLQRQLTRLETATPVDEQAVLAANAALAARLKVLQEEFAASGGSLPALTHLTVVNVKRGATGTDLLPLTPAEAGEAVNAVKAAQTGSRPLDDVK